MSLLEILIVMVLLSLFFGAVYESVIIGLRTANASDEREAVRQQLVKAVDRLTREASVADTIFQSANNLVQFRSDLNSDGSFQPSETVTYQVSSATLQRVDTTGTLTLVSGLTSLTPFTYVDASGNPTNTPANVRVVHVALTAVNDAETLSLTGAAYPRN